MVFGELVMIYAVNHGEVRIVGWRRDQHPLRASIEMRLGFFLGRKDARALERDVDTQRLPWQFGGVPDGCDLDGPDAAVDGIAFDLDLAGEWPVNGIEAQQMRIGLGRRQIVEGHDLDVLASGLRNGTQDIAADPAKSVNGDAN